jgi:hypothetical protein
VQPGNSSESNLHSSDYTGKHCTEDFIRRESKKKESQNTSWRAAGVGGWRKALLPLDKGENYFISVWSS